MAYIRHSLVTAGVKTYGVYTPCERSRTFLNYGEYTPCGMCRLTDQPDVCAAKYKGHIPFVSICLSNNWNTEALYDIVADNSMRNSSYAASVLTP